MYKIKIIHSDWFSSDRVFNSLKSLQQFTRRKNDIRFEMYRKIGRKWEHITMIGGFEISAKYCEKLLHHLQNPWEPKDGPLIADFSKSSTHPSITKV